MFNRADYSKNNDRFISQFHENLVQVTFDHFKKQKDTFKKKLQEKKDENHILQEKIDASVNESKALKKEVEKFRGFCNSRNEGYEKIKSTIEVELDELRTKAQELILRIELKESKNREQEVESDNETNKLSAETQKCGIIGDQLELVIIKNRSLEENIRHTRTLIQKLEQTLEDQKKNLIAVNTHQMQVKKKYEMSKEFIENINRLNDEYIQMMELSNREKKSMYYSKVLHEKFNTRLVNIIIMNNIPNDSTALREMMSQLDSLNHQLEDVSVQLEKLAQKIEEPSLGSIPPKPTLPSKKSSKKKRSKSIRDATSLRTNRKPGGGDVTDSVSDSRRNIQGNSQDVQLLFKNWTNFELSSSDE